MSSQSKSAMGPETPVLRSVGGRAKSAITSPSAAAASRVRTRSASAAVDVPQQNGTITKIIPPSSLVATTPRMTKKSRAESNAAPSPTTQKGKKSLAPMPDITDRLRDITEGTVPRPDATATLSVISPQKMEVSSGLLGIVDEASPPPRPTRRRNSRISKSSVQPLLEGAINVPSEGAPALQVSTADASAAPRRSAATVRKSTSITLDTSVQCPTPMPPSPPMPKPIFIACSLCGLTSPFCAQTGYPHTPVAPCQKCGLSTAFCPLTGHPHNVHIPLAQLVVANKQPIPTSTFTSPSEVERRSGTVAASNTKFGSATLNTSTETVAAPQALHAGGPKKAQPKKAPNAFPLPGSDRHPLDKQLPRPQQPVANGSTKTKQTVPIPSSSVGARRAPNATANKIPTPAHKIPPRSVNSKVSSHPQKSSRKAVAPSGASKSKVAAGAKPPKPTLVPDSELLPIADYLEKHSFLFDTTTPNVPAAAPTPARVSTLSNPEETDNTTSEMVPPETSNSIESNVSKRVTVLPENVDSTTGPLLETLTTPKISRKSSASSPKIAPSFPQCAGCTKPIRPSKEEDENAASQTPSQPHTPKIQTLSVQCVVCARQYHAKCFLQNAGGSQLDKLANGSLNLPSKKLSTAENSKSNISPIPPVLVDVTTAHGHPTPIEWLAAAANTKICQVCLSGKIDLATILQGDSTVPCLSKILTNAASANRVEHYVAQLLVNGFACVPLRSDQKDDNEQSDNTNDEEDGSLIKELTALRTKTDLLYKTLQKCYDIQRDVRPGQTPSLEVGYSNFRERGEGRFELVEPFFLDTLLPLITARGENGSPILEVLRKVLNRDPESQDNDGEAIEPIEDTVEGSVLIKKLRKVDLKPMSSGCFYSLSGSANQNWHTDGPSLSGGGDTDTLLPYAINIFVPLVPLSNQNGTDFQPGSHLAPHTLEGLKKALKAVEGTNFDEGQWDKWYSGKVAPPVGLGEALLFDYRVEHRGLGNRGFADRPCVYITYAQPWYVDTYNFGTKRYAQKLELPADWQVGRSERAARRERLSQQIQSQVE